jgi:regulatory protein
MKITKIERQKHREKFYSVFIDGEYAFHLHKDVLSDLKLETGQEIERREIERIVRLEQVKEAGDYAFLLLSYRSRSSQEIRERLLKKGYENEVIEEVVEKLKGLGYLDDYTFAREWVEKRLREKRGRRLIRQELLQRGLKEEVVEDAITQGLRKIAETENELAWRAIEKRIPQYQKLEKSKAYRRIKNFLNRRGFSIEATENTLDKFFQNYRRDSEL